MIVNADYKVNDALLDGELFWNRQLIKIRELVTYFRRDFEDAYKRQLVGCVIWIDANSDTMPMVKKEFETIKAFYLKVQP